jgi:hypothetical protein
MKPLFVMLLGVTALLFGNCKPRPPVSQASATVSLYLKSLTDTDALLKTFFSPIKITDQNIAIWKPGLDDYFNMEVSADSLCHTRMDTSIALDDKKSLLFFRTDIYNTNGKIIDCHVCAPVYSIATVQQEDDHYVIQNFKKVFFAAGSFGHGYDTLAVETFGKNLKLIHISSSYVGTSTATNTSTYFDPAYYKQVFSFWNYREVGDTTDFDHQEYSHTEQFLVHLPDDTINHIDDLELKGYHKFYDRIKKKIVKQPITEYYRADDFGVYKRMFKQ